MLQIATILQSQQVRIDLANYHRIPLTKIFGQSTTDNRDGKFDDFIEFSKHLRLMIESSSKKDS